MERLRSAGDKDAARAQPKQSIPSNKTPAKNQSVGEKPAGLKYWTKTPNKTPVADRFVVLVHLKHLSVSGFTFGILSVPLHCLFGVRMASECQVENFSLNH